MSPTCATFTVTDLLFVREEVAALAAGCRFAPERAADLLLAVSEVAANSVRHGGGCGVLHWWRQSDAGAEAVVCEVSDVGHIGDPLVGRRTPSEQDEGGRGVWMVNQLCDLVQVRSCPDGTVVRMLVRIR